MRVVAETRLIGRSWRKDSVRKRIQSSASKELNGCFGEARNSSSSGIEDVSKVSDNSGTGVCGGVCARDVATPHPPVNTTTG